MKSTTRFSVDPRLSALLGESYTSSGRSLRELAEKRCQANSSPSGWMLIGRQVRTSFGGIVDLLAIAPEYGWIRIA